MESSVEVRRPVELRQRWNAKEFIFDKFKRIVLFLWEDHMEEVILYPFLIYIYYIGVYNAPYYSMK